jgi:hypothetical protein
LALSFFPQQFPPFFQFSHFARARIALIYLCGASDFVQQKSNYERVLNFFQEKEEEASRR